MGDSWEDFSKQFQMSNYERDEIHEKFTCPMNLVMGLKTGRLSALEALDTTVDMIEYAYLIGVQRGMSES